MHDKNTKNLNIERSVTMATTTSLVQFANVDEAKNVHNLNPKTVGKGVSVTRSNTKIPESVTDVQTLCNALGTLAFKDKYTNITASDFASGVITTELNITDAGKIADARALKTLNDKINTQNQTITQINNKYDLIVQKVDKITGTTIKSTIPSTGWTGEKIPYENTISVEGLKEVDNVEITVDPSASLAQVNAYLNAIFCGGETKEGSVTIKAYGEKPDTDIPIYIIWRGNSNET